MMAWTATAPFSGKDCPPDRARRCAVNLGPAAKSAVARSRRKGTRDWNARSGVNTSSTAPAVPPNRLAAANHTVWRRLPPSSRRYAAAAASDPGQSASALVALAGTACIPMKSGPWRARLPALRRRLLLVLGDHRLRLRLRHRRVPGELHGELPLALGGRAEIRGVPEHLIQRHVGHAHEVALARLGRDDDAAPLIDLPHHRALEVLRCLDLHLHHRLENHRPRRAVTLAEGHDRRG